MNPLVVKKVNSVDALPQEESSQLRFLDLSIASLYQALHNAFAGIRDDAERLKAHVPTPQRTYLLKPLHHENQLGVMLLTSQN
jgi:hypothetical protein